MATLGRILIAVLLCGGSRTFPPATSTSSCTGCSFPAPSDNLLGSALPPATPAATRPAQQLHVRAALRAVDSVALLPTTSSIAAAGVIGSSHLLGEARADGVSARASSVRGPPSGSFSSR
jgi:hypothetical protein